MHSEIPAPVFLMLLIQNDLVLINYHIIPIVILYFWYFCHFKHLGWPYKPPYKFETLTFNLSVHTRSFSFSFPVFSLLSPLSLLFSATKHSSEDDNLEDAWLYLFLLEEEGHWVNI